MELTLALRGLTLPPLRQNFIFRELLQLKDTPQDLTEQQCLALWVGDFLEHLGFLDSAQVQLLLRELWSELSTHSIQVAALSQPSFILAFLDGRYATWPNHLLLDLHTGQHVAQRKQPTLESLAYNLTELYHRNLRNRQSSQGGEHAEPISSFARGLGESR